VKLVLKMPKLNLKTPKRFKNAKTRFENTKTQFENAKTRFKNPKTRFSLHLVNLNDPKYHRKKSLHYDNDQEEYYLFSSDCMDLIIRT